MARMGRLGPRSKNRQADYTANPVKVNPASHGNSGGQAIPPEDAKRS